jgi:membrane protease YdiL (CAAX protease family)
MINGIISALLQIFVFTMIPFIVYIISKKSRKGFFEYIGLKKSNKKANLFAVLLALIIAVPMLLLTLFHTEFYEIMTSPDSVAGKFRQMGFSLSTVLLIGIAAIFKTALAEEILFRGFIAKRIIALTGYQTGNIIQALLFGVLHTLLFMIITTNPLFLAFIFIFPSIGAYLNVYLNEKMADGSIIPSWISHATANLISYSVIGFLI